MNELPKKIDWSKQVEPIETGDEVIWHAIITNAKAPYIHAVMLRSFNDVVFLVDDFGRTTGSLPLVRNAPVKRTAWIKIAPAAPGRDLAALVSHAYNSKDNPEIQTQVPNNPDSKVIPIEWYE